MSFVLLVISFSIVTHAESSCTLFETVYYRNMYCYLQTLFKTFIASFYNAHVIIQRLIASVVLASIWPELPNYDRAVHNADNAGPLEFAPAFVRASFQSESIVSLLSKF